MPSDPEKQAPKFSHLSDSNQRLGWTCFHCAETFFEIEEARLHFGDNCLSEPACRIDIRQYREMETLLARYCAEDSDTDRAMHRMQADHAAALRRAEEEGYRRGLIDRTDKAGR